MDAKKKKRFTDYLALSDFFKSRDLSYVESIELAQRYYHNGVGSLDESDNLENKKLAQDFIAQDAHYMLEMVKKRVKK